MTAAILVTGGAGFIGSSLASALKQSLPGSRVIAFDNLRRRGSELILERLRAHQVEFIHGDVRIASDLAAVRSPVGTVIECSAEPSVIAGLDGQTQYVIDTNLGGLVHCLDFARRHDATLVFLSTSRVYPTAALRALSYREAGQRYVLADDQSIQGASREGISEAFPLDGARTLYGATKLAGELLITEYVDAFGLRAVIDRCGVVAGPWQMGKVEQGVFALWALAHVFERPLRYIGFGGTGRQVRDVLHVDDLADLVRRQLAAPERLRGEVFNVGGGLDHSASLAELTDLCRELSGRQVPVTSEAEMRPGDVPIFVTDARKARAAFAWAPARSLRAMMSDIVQWAAAHRATLEHALS